MSRRNELGQFLRLMRSRQDPADHGIPGAGRRRVPGLRREEVAQLTGISNEYYARLERGVARSPSPAVVDSLARVLRLSRVERDHLADLSAAVSRPPAPAPAPVIRPELAALVDALPGPALVTNHRFDVLAANPLARSVFFDFTTLHGGNLARFLFTDPLAMRRYLDWAAVAQATVGQLRVASVRQPRDAELRSLFADLTADGHHFTRMWAAGDVDERSYGRKRLWVDEVGELDLRFENLHLPEDPSLRLVVLHADPGSVSEDKLRILASIVVERVSARST
ncbi:helix-turn-helix transcriptional regulator [Pseudonocardia sp. CA-107938]|uniref:helix-turn-helix transcriptional regulator n=1 Tax=Pseudonocardia sp. CA-107938 TaxID=3240021 RepID=UPI003D8B9DBD